MTLPIRLSAILLLVGPMAAAGAAEWSYDFYDGDNSAWTGGLSPAAVLANDNWIAPSAGYPGGGTKWPFVYTPPTGDAIMWRRSTTPVTEWSVLGSLITGTQGSSVYSTICMNWAPHTRQNDGAFSYQIPAGATWFELEFYGQPGPSIYPDSGSWGQNYSNAGANVDGFPQTGYAGWGSTNLFGLTGPDGDVEVYFGATQAFWSSWYTRNTMSNSGDWSDLDDRTHLAGGSGGSNAVAGFHTYTLHVDLDGVYGPSGTGTMYVDGVADPSLTGLDMGLTSHPSTWTGMFFMVNSQASVVDDFIIRGPDAVAIPEPATLSLLALGAMGFFVRRRRR